MPSKQEKQQKRLSQNVRQVKASRAELRKPAPNGGNAKKTNNTVCTKTPPGSKQGGVSSLFTRLFGDKPQTAQQSIPYREMYKDGICRVNDKLYTKTVIFNDITYHLAQNEDKTQIFEKYCDFLNYFDSSVSIQLSFINHYGDIEDFHKSIDIPSQNDTYNDIRLEYADMLKNQMAKGNNGLIRNKYITFGIEADNFKAAKMRIERVEADILNNFKILGVSARPLSGAERLEVIHGQLHPDGRDKFRFDWKDIAHAGLTTKDYIAPSGFDFRSNNTFRMGEHYGAASYLQILAPELTDRMLADFIDLDSAVTVNLSSTNYTARSPSQSNRSEGFFGKKEYAAMPDSRFTKKFTCERCLVCSI